MSTPFAAPPGPPQPGPYPGYGHPPQHGYPGFAPVREYSNPGGRELAPATDRLLARIIDVLILAVPLLLVEIPLFVALWFWAYDAFDLGAEPGTAAEPDGGDVLRLVGLLVGALILISLLSALFSYLYEVVYMHRTGQTVGKRLMRVRVVRVADGGPIGTGEARRRWLAQDGVALLGVIPFVGSLVGMYNWLDSLWLLWDKPHRQCLHDKFGKTAVVKLSEADPAPAGPGWEKAA